MPDAIAQFEAAINIRPDYAGAHDNLGNALSQMPGRLPDAIAEYQAALRINPDFVQAHINLGNALLHTGQTAGAIAEYEAAARLQPNPEVQHLVERLRAGQK
jgi:tetratricopeptide (TPR) repeat protein